MRRLHHAANTKILVDSSVWIDFTRGKTDTKSILNLLSENRVLTHVLIEAELRAGQMNIDREQFFLMFQRLEYAPTIAYDELFDFIERRKLFAKGVSFIDVMLIMTAMLCNAQLWTHDKNLQILANELQFGIYYP